MQCITRSIRVNASGSIFLRYSSKSIYNFIKCKKLISNSINTVEPNGTLSILISAKVVNQQRFFLLFSSANYSQAKVHLIKLFIWMLSTSVYLIHSLIWTNIKQNNQLKIKNLVKKAEHRQEPKAFQHSKDYSDQIKHECSNWCYFRSVLHQFWYNWILRINWSIQS